MIHLQFTNDFCRFLLEEFKLNTLKNCYYIGYCASYPVGKIINKVWDQVVFCGGFLAISFIISLHWTQTRIKRWGTEISKAAHAHLSSGTIVPTSIGAPRTQLCATHAFAISFFDYLDSIFMRPRVSHPDVKSPFLQLASTVPAMCIIVGNLIKNK